MPWCPKCGTEYVEGTAECADCGAALVAEPVGEPDSKPGGSSPNGDEVFLCNLSGPVEVSYITSVLEEQGIPYWMTDSEPGLHLEALMGSSFTAKDIYVGKDDFERAAEVVKSFKSEMSSKNGPENK
jgi:hypothetical protein